MHVPSERRLESNSSRHIRRRRQTGRKPVTRVMEALEARRLLCADHFAPGEIFEETPHLIDPATGISPPRATEVADPANIVWTNRANTTSGGAGDTDGFGARFGTSAPLARGVVDAVIVNYERMIGSFDYPLANQTFNVTVNMGAAGGGFGASAGLNSSQGGKPKSGGITMGAGNGSADPNDDNGWFLDPTPFEHSEFLGNIVNAYAGDAHAGSPAAGKGDFYTVVAAELTHCLGLFGNALPGWANRTTNTGILDTASPPGFYWVFDGPSIKHLMTSDNAGSQDWGSAIHSSEGPNANINYNGLNWIGSHDQGNPFYEFGRRYLVNNAFALMFKDAYGYITNNPARDGTFYSVLNQSTGQVTVRGGAGTSADNIQIFRSAGNTLTVAVNVGNDIPGTGALPGAGDLPSFNTVYDVNQVSSIVVNTGAGDDVIFIDTTNFSANLTESFTINAGAGNDSLTLTFFGGNLDYLRGPVTFNGESGNDSITVYDGAATFNDTYTITSTSMTRPVFGGLTYSGTESLFINGQTGHNTFNINSVAAGMTVGLDGRAGNDTFRVGGTTGTAANILGPLTLTGGTGTDTLFYNDANTLTSTTYTINTTSVARSGAGLTTFGTMEGLEFNAGSGNDTINLDSTSATTLVSIDAGNGDDAINVGGGNLSNLLTSPAINARGGNDVLTLRDELSPGSASYTFTGINLQRAGMATVAYGTVESAVLLAQTGNNTIVVDHASPGTNLSVSGSAGTDVITIVASPAANPVTILPSTGNDTVNVNTDNLGTAGALFSQTQTIGTLAIGAGGIATLSSPGDMVLTTQNLSINDTARLDLTNEDMIWDYGGIINPIFNVQQLLFAGRNGGPWSGVGITSSAAAAVPGTAIGYANSTDLFSSFPATFSGQPVDSTAVLLKFTRYGDANLDGTVNLADFNRVAANFGQSGRRWFNGDFDYNSAVNLADFNLLAANFGQSAGQAATRGGEEVLPAIETLIFGDERITATV